MSPSTPLDQELNDLCKHKRCPTDAQFRVFPMLDEDIFDEVGVRLYHCQKCRKRLATISERKSDQTKGASGDIRSN